MSPKIEVKDISDGTCKMKIIIIGAGLGGLSAAICFSKRGHDVQLLERHRELAVRGGGLAVRPNASQILHSWGLRGSLEEISTDTTTVLMRSMTTGDIVTQRVAVDASDHPDWGTTRQELMQALYKEACSSGSDICFGKTVVDVSEDSAGQQASVKLEDGTRLTADLVISADGIRSRLRSKILSDLDCPTEPLLSKCTFYGTQVPASELRMHSGTSRLIDQASINSWMGDGSYVITRYNPKTDEAGLLFGINSETDQKDLWDENGDIEYVCKFFEGACTEIATGLRLAKTCDRWKLAEMPDLPRWASKGGRVLLLGDAAHAMHPNAAQGYSQIVEDIGVLDTCIQELLPKGVPIPAITATWEKIRKPRVERIKEFAKWNTNIFSNPTAALVKTQHKGVVSLKDVQPDMNAPFFKSPFLKWVIGHDAIQAVRRPEAEKKNPVSLLIQVVGQRTSGSGQY